jgi:hypothetical protein
VKFFPGVSGKRRFSMPIESDQLVFQCPMTYEIRPRTLTGNRQIKPHASLSIARKESWWFTIQ